MAEIRSNPPSNRYRDTVKQFFLEGSARDGSAPDGSVYCWSKLAATRKRAGRAAARHPDRVQHEQVPPLPVHLQRPAADVQTARCERRVRHTRALREHMGTYSMHTVIREDVHVCMHICIHTHAQTRTLTPDNVGFMCAHVRMSVRACARARVLVPACARARVRASVYYGKASAASASSPRTCPTQRTGTWHSSSSRS